MVFLRKRLAVVATATFLLSGPGLAQTNNAQVFANVPGCTSPTLLTNAYAQGAQNGYQTVQSTFTKPPSVLNLSCLNSLLGGGGLDVLFNVNTLIQGLLNAASQQVCQAAQSAWSSGGLSSFSPQTLFAQSGLGAIPGLTLGNGGIQNSGVVPLSPGGVQVVAPGMPAGVGPSPAGTGQSSSSSLGNIFQ